MPTPRRMTIYTARCRGNKKNTIYPDWRQIDSADDLRQAATFDHVCAEYEDNHRSNERFICSDCLPLDLDNSHSDDPADWKTLEDVRAAFPGVPFYAVPSRHHMKPKPVGKGATKSARPRYHVYFPIDEVTDYTTYRALKDEAVRRFEWFDLDAKDSARFLFGVETPEVITVEGDAGATLTAALGPVSASETADDDFPAPTYSGGVIPAGQRNSTLSHMAGLLLKRYGADDGRARKEFDRYADRCDPPLETEEVETIWKSALQFFKKISASPDYLPPEEYELADFAPELKPDLVPKEFTDVGEALTFAALYGDRLRYSKATGWMVYDGMRWTEDSEAAARGIMHRLTKRQARKARDSAMEAVNALMQAKEAGDDAAAQRAEKAKADAEQLHKFARQYQRSARISATLTEATPYLSITIDKLDADAFLLNTPGGTVDLQTGEIRPHDPADFCTKLTGCAPDGVGREMFDVFLERVTCEDNQLAEYLQQIAGMFAVGAVYRENLIIAYGRGGNGKSTLFNLLSYVMGDYAGSLSAETLTMNCRKNKSPEYAELRGRRLVIAAELEEGMRFDTSIVKKLCSTDPIYAEKKFKDPFSFIPSHTLVLYTNHLPKVGTVDGGTWDRMIVVPFLANFRGWDGEVLNYAQFLFKHAGGAVLQWMIDGARRFIETGFKIVQPDCVREAVEEYREENDWLQQFLENCCDVGPNHLQSGGVLYARYRAYCAETGEYTRHLTDFKRALLANGFEFHKGKTGCTYRGLRLRPSYAPAYDFTPAFDPLS